MLILKEILPRLVLAVLLLTGAYFAFFESVYLQDQAAEFGQFKVALWMWIFRVLTTALVISGVAFGYGFLRRLLG